MEMTRSTKITPRRIMAALVLAAIFAGGFGYRTVHAAPLRVAQDEPFAVQRLPNATVSAVAGRGGSPSVGVAAAFSETVVFDIAEYVIDDRITINVSSTLEGPIQSGTDWSLCAGATNVLVSSNGDVCYHDTTGNRIVCPATTQHVEIAYSCGVAFTGIYSVVVFQFVWEFNQPTDRTTEVRYPSHLTYREADPQPAELLPGKLRWFHQDEVNFSSTIAFQDTDVRSIYLPLIVK